MLTDKQIQFFNENGFLIVENFVDSILARAVADRFDLLFRGEFETTVPPDEWRWAMGRDPLDVTRMIWNGWKSDRTVATLALSEQVGQACSQLGGWTGARLNQDGCIWKPPHAKGLSYHQDGNYIQWVVPAQMVTCWIALDDVSENSGTLEYAKGSHLWGRGEKPLDFHSPVDYQACFKEAARGREAEIIKVAVPAGSAAFHHCWLWHGSGVNETELDRRALALHCMPELVEFHETNPAYAQGRFRKFGGTVMEESFYPILWSETGYRSPCIDAHLQGASIKYTSHIFISEY
jgi:ectoine hydroxylase-related dioxygenase (phytanoyl-CoA dioxygenase family)